MRFEWEALRRLQAERLLAITTHADTTLGVWLLNYSDRAQYADVWDDYPALRDCRGTIIDGEGRVIAKPFRKFFNVGERPETAVDALAPLGVPEITHKLDGSMVTLWRAAPDDRVRFATRGSLTSPQVKIAETLWYGTKGYDGRVAPLLNPAYTYVCELVSPRNRIVVQYDEEDLALIGVIETETGYELPYTTMVQEAARLGLPLVPLYDVDPEHWETIHTLPRANFEGFVLFWPDAQRRVKVKLAEYLRLHRVITGLSERTVWELLRSGQGTDALRRDLPEEMRMWLDGVEGALRERFAAYEGRVRDALAAIAARGLDAADRAQRKEVAALIVRDYPRERAVLFAALDAKNVRDRIWRELEPTNRDALWTMQGRSAE